MSGKSFKPSDAEAEHESDLRRRAELLCELGRLNLRIRELEDELGLARPIELPKSPQELEQAALELFWEYSTDFLSMHSASGIYLFASPSVKHLFGWGPEQLVGRSAYEFFHADDLDRIAQDHAAHSLASPGRVQYRLRCADNSYRWVETRSRARLDDAGVQQILCITVDIHAEVVARSLAEVAERKLVESHAAEVVARFVDVLGHELNSPLTALQLAVDMLDEETQNTHGLRDAVQRLRAVVAELKLCSSVREPEGPVELGQALERVLRLLGSAEKRVLRDVPPLLVQIPPLRLYQLLHAVLQLHLESDAKKPTILLRAEKVDDQIELDVKGGSIPAARLRTSLLGMLSGAREEVAADLPARLAERLAIEMGAECIIEGSGGTLHTHLILPSSKRESTRT